MIEKINNIKNSKHPYTDEISSSILFFKNFFNILIIVFNVMGFIVATVATVGLVNYSSSSVTVNFFGYIIELGSDTLACFPFILFMYIISIFLLISLAFICIKLFITEILRSKRYMLNSLYRNEKLTELLIINNCDIDESELNNNQNFVFIK